MICILIVLCLATQALTAHADEAAWDGLPAVVTEVKIKVEDVQPNGFNWEGLARSLIRLKQGDTLTVERLERAKQDLAPIGSVKAEALARPQGVALIFTFRPYKRIKSITIRGAYPLFQKDVRNAMAIAVGDIFLDSKMGEQEELVAQRYRNEGYVDPKVRIEWTQDTQDGHYYLRVAIQKGEPFFLEKVRLHGNRAIAEASILGRMQTWRKAAFRFGAGRFVSQLLKEDVRRLTEFYRQEGFADVVITSAESRDPVTHGVVCDLTIEEGPRYTIAIEGNHFFSNFRLRKELVLFKVGNLGGIGLRRSIQNIRRRYLRDGFVAVKVRSRETSRTEADQEQRAIVIEIDEGARHLVTAVSFQGNTHFETKVLQKQMLTRPSRLWRRSPYVVDTLQEDMVAIRAQYQNDGYLNAQVAENAEIDPQQHTVQVTITIDEGAPTRVAGVALASEVSLPRDPLDAALELKPGTPYAPFKLQNDENRISAYIAAMGYPHVQVKGTEALTTDLTQADIAYHIEPGPAVQTGEIFFLGNFRTRERFMRREVDLAPGEPFALQEVIDAQRNLRDLNIFDSVQVVPVGLKEKEPVVDLLVKAVEKPPYYFELGGGYKTDTGIFGRTKIGDHNFVGTGKDVALSGEMSEVGYRWDTGISEPRFLGQPIRARAGVYLERSEPFNQDFGTDTEGGNLNFSHDWKTNNTIGLATRFEHRQQYLREESASNADQESDAFDPRTLVAITPSVQYDGRDSFIRPQRGQFAAFSVDISKGLDNTLDDFLKYRLDLRTYHTVMEGVTLAGRAWVGYLEPYGGDVPPLDQLFFLGGTNSVRGFEENLLRFDADGNAVGGQLAMTVGLEARIDIGHNFELIPFVDTGSVQQALTADGDDEFHWSTGLGLQYITPIGPIGLFYGHKLNRRDGESAGQVHLSIGYAF
ncbi:MAG: outer membrane protein assembly factor BamA [Desulfatitalea sp.]